MSAKKRLIIHIQTATAKGEYVEINTRMRIHFFQWHTARRSASSDVLGCSSGEVFRVLLPSGTGSRNGEGVLESLLPSRDILAGGLQRFR